MDIVSTALVQNQHQTREPLLRLLDQYVTGVSTNHGFIEAVAACLEDAQMDVRHLAVEVLARVGSVSAVDCIVRRLEHPESSVRCAAVEALVRLAPTGEVQSHAIDKLAALMEDSYPTTRVTVV